MISLRDRWLFIHNPRTGGNSLQSVLAPHSDDRITTGRFRDGIDRFGVHGPHTATKHASMNDYARVLAAGTLDDLFKFTVVRNPWERAVSAYFTPMRWIRMNTQPVWVKETFVAMLPELPGMAEMLRGPDGRMQVDFVMRFERLRDDVATLFGRLGYDLTLPHRNQGVSDRHWRQYYEDDPDLIDVVGGFFFDDADAFDYSFAD